MKRLALLLPLLAACGTPQEQCIAKVTRDQRVVETLITEAEGNLARGYALEEYTTYQLDWQICHRQPRPEPLPKKGHKPPPPDMCWEREPVTRTRPVAIDLGAEAAKLAQLRDQRAVLIRQASPSIAQCKAQFPE